MIQIQRRKQTLQHPYEQITKRVPISSFTCSDTTRLRPLCEPDAAALEHFRWLLRGLGEAAAIARLWEMVERWGRCGCKQKTLVMGAWEPAAMGWVGKRRKKEPTTLIFIAVSTQLSFSALRRHLQPLHSTPASTVPSAPSILTSASFLPGGAWAAFSSLLAITTSPGQPQSVPQKPKNKNWISISCYKHFVVLCPPHLLNSFLSSTSLNLTA